MTKQEKDRLYYLQNRARKIAWQKKYASTRKEAISLTKAAYYAANKEMKKSKVSEYRQLNKGKVNALNRKHQLAKQQRTPKWLTPLHYQQIEIFYDAAARLTTEFGVAMEVDHIVPLKGKNVSGLHVPWNLQVLTKEENSRKKNKYEDRNA